MAIQVPKSYQATITLSGGPAGPTTYPHTFTDKIFQVPAGKTWQVTAPDC